MSSLNCKALGIVNKYLLSSICSSLVHFKNGPKYLISETALIFILWIKFRPRRYVSRFFSRSSLLMFPYFFYLRLFDGVCFQHSQVFVILLLPGVMILFMLGNSIPFVTCLFRLFIMCMVQFLLLNSIPMSCLIVYI